MIEPTTLTVSGARLTAVYEFLGDPSGVERRAEALRVEQTIEFPADLVPDDDIQREIIGRIESVDQIDDDVVHVTVSYAVETTGFELPQLLNVLWGNSALLPNIRLVDFALPEPLLSRFTGPRLGVDGLRRMFDAPRRPLLATALKPMGLSADRLAQMAYELALGGIDMIKDDHSLANQEYAPFHERVEKCAEAVRKANDQTGFSAVYLPSLNAPHSLIERRLAHALDVGAGGLLILPGITGLDVMRDIAARNGVTVPIMAHPAFLGSFSASATNGIEHGTLYGKLMRIAGADLSIFPNYGGRFSFSPEQCRRVAESLAEPIPGIAEALPAPGGGMTLDRVGEITEFYGNDVALLIGGDLHRGDSLEATAARFRAAVEG